MILFINSSQECRLLGKDKCVLHIVTNKNEAKLDANASLPNNLQHCKTALESRHHCYNPKLCLSKLRQCEINNLLEDRLKQRISDGRPVGPTCGA